MKRCPLFVLLIATYFTFGLFSTEAQSLQEVWYGGSTCYSINRLTFDGTPLPSINIGADHVQSLTVVGNEVWWWGESSWNEIH